ncbi:UNVERIFIED_CONTAM: hypothetical protein FKN15_045297 [Acipenser sinensis]
MAEPRKVAFITLSPPDSQKRCWEDEPCSPAAPMASGNNIFPGTGTAAAGEKAAGRRITVRLNLRLSEPSEQASAEFNYSELVQSIQKLKEGEERGMKKRKRKEEGSSMEKEKKPRKNRVPKTLG